jgi:hypothetical protein
VNLPTEIVFLFIGFRHCVIQKRRNQILKLINKGDFAISLCKVS